MTFCRKFIRLGNQRGAAMVEMALAVPLFVALLLALVDFGMYFTAKSVLQSAAYNGAKVCSTTLSQVQTIVYATVDPVVDHTKYPTQIKSISITGTAPLTRATVILELPSNGVIPSILTSALGLYPIKTTGLAKCP